MKLKLTDKQYDIIKYTAMIVLPAICTLCTTLAILWDLPYVGEIAGTIAACNTFAGAVTAYSKYQYDKENDNATENKQENEEEE